MNKTPHNRPPLLVSVVFHPASESARQLAHTIHRALNTDPAIPGLRIPTAFCPGDANHPGPLAFDQAERHAVVVLADEVMDARDPWPRYVGDLHDQCRKLGHRFIPVQLSESAYPLDERLSELNFARAYLHSGESQADFVVQRLMIGLSRFLNDQPRDAHSSAPVTVFVSHAKGDLKLEPKAAQSIMNHLKVDQPVNAWVDSGDIEAGSRFAKEIKKGVADAALLCVLTNSYASRAWCRREVLFAKEMQRPVVVVNALRDMEIRSFPYLGNVPVLHWRDNAEDAIALLLKENLHHLHTLAVLKQWSSKETDNLYVRPPELATLITLPKGATVLYPDPPLGREEVELLEASERTVRTPLQRLARKKPLAGQQIALSMSEPTDIGRRGLGQMHFDDLILDVSKYLLIQGATLAYGGHLGAAGYTTKLTELITTYNRHDDDDSMQRLVNYVGWPLPRPDDKEVSERKAGCQLEVVDRPDDIDETLGEEFIESPEFFPATSVERRFAWSRGMTHMRETQTGNIAARVVIGGVFGPTFGADPDGTQKEKWYASRIPGVLEEIMLSVQADRPVPVFLVGAFGGVAGLVGDILTNSDDTPEAFTWDVQSKAPHARGLPDLYAKRGLAWQDYPEMIDILRSKGLTGINPLLEESEHRALLTARDPLHIVELILKGMSRLP